LEDDDDGNEAGFAMKDNEQSYEICFLVTTTPYLVTKNTASVTKKRMPWNFQKIKRRREELSSTNSAI
jgi:hypothetical protein